MLFAQGNSWSTTLTVKREVLEEKISILLISEVFGNELRKKNNN